MKKILIILFFLIVHCTLKIEDCEAQWVQISNGMYRGTVQCFAVSGTNLFVGMGFGGCVFLSTNNGANWTSVNYGLTNRSVYALAFLGPNYLQGQVVAYFYQQITVQAGLLLITV